MKVGFVFDDSLDRNDGVQQYIRTVSNWLIKSGHEVRFLVGETNNAGDLQPFVYSLAKNRRVSFNKNKLSLPQFVSKRKIREILNKEKFDVLHIKTPFSPMLSSKVIRSAGPRTGVLASFHIVGNGWLEKTGLRLLGFIQQLTIRRIDHFLAVSPAAQTAAQTYFTDFADVSPNVLALDKFKNEASEKVKGRIVYLGRLVERKGVMHLVDAISLLKNKQWFGGAEFCLAGTGPLREALEQKIIDLGLEGKVKLIGAIAENDKAQYLHSGELAIFPATGGESFGIVLIEAIAAGTLTIGGDNPGYATVLNGPQEMLVSADDHAALASRIDLLMTDSDLHSKLFSWQQKRIEDFDIEKVGPRLLQHYRAAQRHSISLSKNRRR